MELAILINKYKIKILNSGLIILALIIAGNIYSAQTKDMRLLKEKQETEIKKNELLESIAGTEEQINSYKNLFTESDANLIGTISNIAKSSNVNILSIKPEPEEKTPDYTRLPISLVVSAANYQVLRKFIGNIEGAQNLFIIHMVGIRPSDAKTAGKSSELTANLRISTIVFPK